MTLFAEDKKTLSQFRLQKAKEFLDDAKKILMINDIEHQSIEVIMLHLMLHVHF